ncbi:hypothetical protein QJS10_CPB11g01830 [Acorus calamus]|uniref:PGG domain-containing protein n=1 Tax=Acorus calamus TaxID=4465 RepID=A0AAV9DST0_ACOCL|nr:hypothetical protein QJS10_CPB11g01830 [Acorus calamus]
MGWSEVFFKEVRGALLMVAALIATVTFSAGIYPPGGFWQDDGKGHTAGKPILADKNMHKYKKFMDHNTHAFIQSLLLIMLLIFSYATPCHTLLVALVFCVGVSLLVTMVLMASEEMKSYALIYLVALSIVIFVTWIITCLGRLAKRLTIGESRAAAAEGGSYSMEDGTRRGP